MPSTFKGFDETWYLHWDETMQIYSILNLVDLDSGDVEIFCFLFVYVIKTNVILNDTFTKQYL